MKRSAFEQIYEFEDHHWWFRARRDILGAVLDRFSRGSGHRILEIGCGSGGNFGLLSKYGSIHAVEPEDEARRRAVSRGMAEVEGGLFPDEMRFQGPFDLVCMLDVIEHLDNDGETLLAAGRLLTDDGLLVVTVPAYTFLWSRHDEINEHRRRYTRAGLVSIAAEAGLSVRYVSYFNTVLFPLVAAVRLAGRLGWSGDKPDFRRHSRWADAVLFAAMSSERRLMTRFSLPFGVSILLVASKQATANHR